MKKFLKPNKPTAKQVAQEPAEQAGRVTNETVLEHREAVLGNARKFKYPFQRSKHRIAIISVLLVLLGLILLGLFTSFQLYRRQSTGIFTYRVTQVLPFPVAQVDGATTTYESYLFELNSSIHWQEKYGTTDLRSPDGQRQIEYLKRQALDKAIANTIAQKLAKENNIQVSGEEVDAAVERVKSVGGDLKTILADQYGFGESEFRRLKHDALLREKVAHQLDKDAPKRAQAALAAANSGAPFTDVAKERSEDLETKQLGGELGVVERGRANLPDEVVDAIFKLEAGKTSEVISTPGDYYIVHVSERVNETRAKVFAIRIKVKDMTQYLKEYKDQDRIKEHIKLEDTSPQQARR